MTIIDRTPAVVEPRWVRGDAFDVSFDFSATFPDTATDTWEAQIRRGGTLAQAFSVDNDGAGIITISVTAVESAGLVEANYVWDLQRTPAGGDPITYLGGPVVLTSEVTA